MIVTQSYCPFCMSPIEPDSPCPKCGRTPDTYHPEPHHLPPGTMLMDRYVLGRALGEGGFGITYIGRDTRLDLRIAVKEYFPNTQVTRDASVSENVTRYNNNAGKSFNHGLERFLQEAKTMARMDKTPEIVGVRDFFQANGTAYIVMEYVDGTTLKELVQQYGGAIPVEELLPMIQPLFGALETMHKRNLIHRDISPDNIMMENGKVRLLDFGCAREAMDSAQTMTVMLKQGYSPIEQYQHKGQGPWTDVYSLAATIYYCITGTTPPQPLDRLIDEELVLPRKFGVHLTEQQELALLYGMGLQPNRRFRSIQEFYASLYEGVPIPVEPAKVLPKNTGTDKIQGVGPSKNGSTILGFHTLEPEGWNWTDQKPDLEEYPAEQTDQKEQTEEQPGGKTKHEAQTAEEGKTVPQTGKDTKSEAQTGTETPSVAKTGEDTEPGDQSGKEAASEEPAPENHLGGDRDGGKTKPEDSSEAQAEDKTGESSTSEEKPENQPEKDTKSDGQSADKTDGEAKSEKSSGEDNGSEDKTSSGVGKTHQDIPKTRMASDRDGDKTKRIEEPGKKQDKHSKEDPSGKEKTTSKTDSASDKKTVEDTNTSRDTKHPGGTHSKSSGGAKKALLGVGAAAVLGVGIWFAATNLGPSPNPQNTTPGTVTESAVPENVSTAKDKASFLAALEDSTVTAVHVAPGSSIGISEPLEIHKPVVLEHNSKINCTAPVSFLADCTLEDHVEWKCSKEVSVSAALTISADASLTMAEQPLTVLDGGLLSVADGGTLDTAACTILLDGGQLSVDGYLSNQDMIRTVNGGSIAVGDTGSGDCNVLWLQQDQDLTGGDKLSLGKRITLNEDLFADATSVSDMDSLLAALYDASVTAIRLDADITLDWGLTLAKPLLIPEDIHLIGNPEGSQIILASTLVNHGYMDDIHLALRAGKLLSDGSAALFCSDGENGTLVNLGDLALVSTDTGESSLYKTTILNRGHIGVGNPDWAVQTVLTECDLWNMKGSTVSVQSGSTLTANLGLGMHNDGVLEITEGSTLVNNGVLTGTLQLQGTLENEKGVLALGALQNNGGAIHGGLVLAKSGREGLFDPFDTTVLVQTDLPDSISVENTEDFNKMLTQGEKNIFLASGTVEVDGSLELSKSLTIGEGASLTIHGTLTMNPGTSLTVRGLLAADGIALQDAALTIAPNANGIRIDNAGSLQLNRSTAELYGLVLGSLPGGDLALENGSVLYNEGTLNGLGISLTDSYLANSGTLQFRSGTPVSLTNSTLNTVSGLSLDLGTLTVDQNSTFLSGNPLRLSMMNIDNDGTMKVAGGSFDSVSADQSFTFTNRGTLEIGGYWSGYGFTCPDHSGEPALDNQGSMTVSCGLTVQYMVNRGELILKQGGKLHAGIQLLNQGVCYREGGTVSGTITGQDVIDR